MEYKVLNQTHEDYDADHMHKMSLLYKGGYQIMNEAELFIPKLHLETKKVYTERLKASAYQPYLASFINDYAAYLFSDDLLVKEASDADDPESMGDAVQDEDFYKEFSSNCDNQNNSLHNFMRDVFVKSLYYPWALVGIDFEQQEVVPTNRYEEEELGETPAHLYTIDPECVIDWDQTDNNKFKFIKMKYDQWIKHPLQPTMHQIIFKIWTLNPDGTAHWEMYKSNILPLKKEPKPHDDLPLAGSGDTSFQEIPIFDLSIPCGLHVGDKLGPICEELFNRSSFLVSNMNKSCVSIPVVYQGPEVNDPGEMLPSEVQQNPNRGETFKERLVNQGFMVLGSGDEAEILESAGSSFALIKAQLDDLVTKMYQINNQMAQSVDVASKQSASAASKAQDRNGQEKIATSYSQYVKDFVKEIYMCLSGARQEDIVWDIEGLSNFEDEDANFVEQSVKVNSAIAPLIAASPTFKKKYYTRLASSVLGEMSSEEKLQIQSELEKSLPKESEELGKETQNPENNIIKEPE